MKSTLADQLRLAVKKSGLSANAMSKLTGIPQQRLSDFIRGRDIKLSTAQKIAGHFGLILSKPRSKTKS